MNVLCKSDCLEPLLAYLESVLGSCDTPVNDAELNAVTSYLLSDRNLEALLRRYRKGHVTPLELIISELLMDECVRMTIEDLVQAVYDNLQQQLGSASFQHLKTTRGLLIVKLRSQ